MWCFLQTLYVPGSNNNHKNAKDLSCTLVENTSMRDRLLIEKREACKIFPFSDDPIIEELSHPQILNVKNAEVSSWYMEHLQKQCRDSQPSMLRCKKPLNSKRCYSCLIRKYYHDILGSQILKIIPKSKVGVITGIFHTDMSGVTLPTV